MFKIIIGVLIGNLLFYIFSKLFNVLFLKYKLNKDIDSAIENIFSDSEDSIKNFVNKWRS